MGVGAGIPPTSLGKGKLAVSGKEVLPGTNKAQEDSTQEGESQHHRESTGAEAAPKRVPLDRDTSLMRSPRSTTKEDPTPPESHAGGWALQD
ncbi:hypothetical protein NDU88_008273 [Pleurodeles waltl]|uniref:Uncharacterized protein n=1 Tax=Pleurodeles waltl TaxID=8319 RepID=A0AAV7U2J7_PLEWA|nr:hypothetical protein NDU88_008273 [Pleurodeles waltl]